MAYVVDSNGFIQADNLYYSRDFCPAYWDWLQAEGQAGRVISIDRVYTEIQAKQDDLAQWVSRPEVRGLFLPSGDAATVAVFRRIVDWVQSRQRNDGSQFYRNAARNDFFGGGADPDLIAYALAHGHTVVTAEGNNPANRSKVLIPVVCDGLDVEWVSIFDLLRREQARFVLG